MAVDVASLVIRVSSLEAQSAARDLDRLSASSARTDRAARQMSGGFASVGSALKGMLASLAAVAGFAQLASAFIKANIEAERLSKGLAAVAGTATAGAAEMAYVSKTADKLGLSLASAGSAYVSLTAATKGTALEGKATRDIFESVSLAMGKLGKSAADTQGALTAIEQMISKGKVSAEELRGQLGERLPGAFKLAAEAMGVTTAELDAMLMKGQVVASDLLPALSQKLNALYDDGKEIGGLEAEWNRLVNALDRMLVSANGATGATSSLGAMLQWATGHANSLAEAMQVIANWQEGKGFAYGERDGLADDYALRAKLLTEYVSKMKDAQAYLNESDLDNAAARRAEGEALMARIIEIDARTKQVRADVREARAEAEAVKQLSANSMGDDAVRLYREEQAARAANLKQIDTMNGKYDEAIAKKAEYAKMEALVAEAIKLGTLTQEQGKQKLAEYAAAQDKATASSRSRTAALSAEAQVVAQVEQKYGLMKGQLDAVWKLESSRGKGAGTDSVRWVKDLAAGEGHMTKIVGQFQMAEGTAKGLGANMATFNGQADAAGKYLAQAAAQGKTLWEQFAYYHGGPNEKAWGEKTRAYADAAVKIVADATGTMQDLGQNTGKVITDTLNKANAAVQSLIQRYLPARAAAEEYAQAQQALALASDAAGLSQEEQAIILQGLQQDLQNSKVKATETANAWSEVWKNAVKRIDDTFASLWKDLFSGTKSTLESMKSAISSWLAEVAHALLTKPLVVAITTAMTGGSGVASAAGTAGQAASGLGGFSNFASLASNIFSLGSTFISGLSEGIMGMFTTNMFSTLSTAWGAATSGSAMGAAAGAGVIAAYALPLVAAGGLILSKYFKDQEPRYGAYGATTTGRTDQFEDEVGVKGGFGLTFGMNDMGTANVDAEEMRGVFEGFAKVSQALADFYGKDVASQVEASLKKASEENWGKNGLMNYAMSAEQAFQIAFTDIIKHAAATGDAVAVVMSSVVGSLQGTLEQMADQIERGMMAAKAAVGMAEAFQGQEMGDRLGLADKDTVGNALMLVDYAKAMQQAGETTAEAMGRMALNLGVFDAAMTLTGTTTEATGMAFIDLANGLADAADAAKIGMGGLMQLQSAYYDHFFTEEEKALKQKEAALKAINTWNWDAGNHGDAAIKTSADFRKYIESLDLTSEAGQKAYVEAMKMVGAFISLDDALGKLGDTVPGLVDKFEAQRKAMRDLADQLDPTDPLSQSQRDAALAALQKAGYQGSLYDAKGIAAFLRALADLDDAGGEAGAELQKFIDTFTGVFDELARIAEERAGLEMRLLELTGTDAEILAAKRRLEMAATDESNRVILARIYQLEDEAAALAKAKAAAEAAEAARRAAYDKEVQAINEYNAAAQQAANEANAAAREALQAMQQAAEAAYQTANSIAQAWLEALSAVGLEAEAKVLSRKLQAAAMDPALRSVYAVVWQIQDAAEKAAAQGDLAIQALGYLDRDKDATAATRRMQLAATDPSLRAMQEWVWQLEDAREAADKAGEAIQTLIDGLKAVSGALDDTIKTITDLINGSSPAALVQTRQAAQRDLAAQLSAAQAGTMPTTESLEETLATLGKDPSAQFGDRTAYLRDLGRTRGQLASLKGIVDKQIPIEEQNLEALKKLPVALYPNFEAIVASIGTTGTDTGNLLRQATAAVDAAIAAMKARDDAMDQSIKDIVPALKEIPPYIEDAADTTKINLIPLQTLAADIVKNLAAIDLNVDGMVSYDEFAAFFGGLASDEEMKGWFAALDLNGDGILSALELQNISLASMATRISEEMAKIDLNVNGTVERDEFEAFFGGLADKDEMRQWFNDLDLNGDHVLDKLELNNVANGTAIHWLDQIRATTGEYGEAVLTGNGILGTIDADTNNLGHLPNISSFTGTTRDYAAYLPGSRDHLSNISSYTLGTRDYAAYLPGSRDHLSNIRSYTLGTRDYAAYLPGSRDHLSNIRSYTLGTRDYAAYLPNSRDHLSNISSYTLGTRDYAAYLPNSRDHLSNISSYTLGTRDYAAYLPNSRDHLSNISSFTGTTRDYAAYLPGSRDHLSNISGYTYNDQYYNNINQAKLTNLWGDPNYGAASNYTQTKRAADNTKSLATGNGFPGYATGGIATGSLNGYQATLHGTEAIIPLGDGNSVTAHLTAPLPNYIAQEAGDGPELRLALAELQAEIAALRGEQQTIGAATIGELKDHNKRERKRDVVPQQIEVIS
jgi:tape measure domain-containing protein